MLHVACDKCERKGHYSTAHARGPKSAIFHAGLGTIWEILDERQSNAIDTYRD
jgi:hypothetical protein